MPVCSSCNREISPGEVATHFPCPSCGQVEIWRCSKCRHVGNEYTCSACGFTGP